MKKQITIALTVALTALCGVIPASALEITFPGQEKESGTFYHNALAKIAFPVAYKSQNPNIWYQNVVLSEEDTKGYMDSYYKAQEEYNTCIKEAGSDATKKTTCETMAESFKDSLPQPSATAWVQIPMSGSDTSKVYYEYTTTIPAYGIVWYRYAIAGNSYKTDWQIVHDVVPAPDTSAPAEEPASVEDVPETGPHGITLPMITILAISAGFYLKSSKTSKRNR